jgi:hypothetical protein
MNYWFFFQMEVSVFHHHLHLCNNCLHMITSLLCVLLPLACLFFRENKKLLIRRQVQKILIEWHQVTDTNIRDAIHRFAVALGLQSSDNCSVESGMFLIFIGEIYFLKRFEKIVQNSRWAKKKWLKMASFHFEEKKICVKN